MKWFLLWTGAVLICLWGAFKLSKRGMDGLAWFTGIALTGALAASAHDFGFVHGANARDNRWIDKGADGKWHMTQANPMIQNQLERPLIP